ncbi:N-acetyl-alpha-D-glucosaminyl L-malate synthase BshA [Flavobacteriaceae bacterium]|jgi:N-acetyl-alpha-D-glucosaminyl L-malate synthase BshA|nr:N-acetyl-alpha-D-glucosaminyl L-malate synthase BshA [Flavobacteriaceae bacterium]
MNIAIVCYPTFGGSGVLATELGIALADMGHQVHFVTYKQPVKLALLSHHVHFHEVAVPDYPLFRYQPYELALSSKLVNVVKDHNIEILHVHYAIPHAYAGYMAQQMLLEEGIKIPMVTTLHGTDITLVGNHPFYKPAVTFSINNSDAVTSVSESLKQDTLTHFTIKRPIEVIPNFIDLSKMGQQDGPCERNAMAEPHERIITHVSNLRPVKRLLDVVEIFDQILEQCPARLVIVGDGPDKDLAKALIEQKGIKSKVQFMGNSDEVHKILCLTDLFLLPSEIESFGLAALEAMACRVPVISTDVGGLPEVNKHGFSGYLSEVGDVSSMAKYALSILKDEPTLNQFKDNARAQAKNFAIELIVPQYEELYARTIAETARVK